MAIQLQSAYDELELLKQDLSDVTNDLFISWANHVNRFAFGFIAGIDPERFIQEQNFSNVVTGGYNLPSDFESLQQFNTGFFYVDSNGNATDQRLPLLPFGSPSTGYYINGTQVQFLNVTTQTNYVLRYMPKAPTFTVLTDYFTVDKLSSGKEIIPDEYLLYVRSHLDVMYAQWDEDIAYESVADARFTRELSRLASEINRTPSVYAQKNFSVIF